MTPPKVSRYKRAPRTSEGTHWPAARPLVERGLTLQRVADRTGASPSAVSRWADRHGVPRHTRPRHPRELVEEVQRRVLAGERPLDVHRSLQGVAYTTVCRWAREAGAVRGRPAP